MAYRSCESKYNQFEYLDKLIRLFRKSRPGTPVSFQNEEVKKCLLTGLLTGLPDEAGKNRSILGPIGCIYHTNHMISSIANGKLWE